MNENCNSCNKDYAIDTGNAKLHLFIEDFMANHVEAKCRNCGEVEVIFTTPAGFVRLQQESKLGIIIHLKADPSLIKRAEMAWGRHEQQAVSHVELPVYDLTDRHEQAVSGFASNLAAIPDELFWAFIEDETNHDLPERWV